jgi:hypothetical protein
MDKMAQWKSSILGINKSSNGGPVKGKMPMSAPMAKYANGGRVVKMQEGGSMKEMAKKYASKAIEGVKNASASVKSAASRATTRPKDMSGTIDKVEAAIRSASGRAFTVPKSAKAAVLRAVTPPKSTMGDNEKDTSVKINSMPTDSDSGPGDYGRDEPEMDISDIFVISEKRNSSLPKPKAKAKATAKKKDAPMSDAELIARAEKRSGEKMFAGYKPSMPDPTKKSHGGKVMADGGAVDMKQDKAMIARHNRLMHSGQKSKLKNGGMMKKGDGGAMRVQGNMKRPQFSASKSFDGGKTRIGMSAGKGNFRASFSKKFADGGAVTRLANEASGVISDMTKNRAMMKKGGSVKKGSMMKAKGSMMKAMSNKR